MGLSQDPDANTQIDVKGEQRPRTDPTKFSNIKGISLGPLASLKIRQTLKFEPNAIAGDF